MLAKSSLSNIRRLISQKKGQEEGDEFMEYGAAIRVGHGLRASQSWMTTKETRRKSPPAPIVIQHVPMFEPMPSLSDPRPAPRLPDTPPLSSSPASMGWQGPAPKPVEERPRTPRTARTSHSRQSSKSLSPSSRPSPQVTPHRQPTISARQQAPRRKPVENSPRPSLNLPEKQNHFVDVAREEDRRVTIDPSRLEGWSDSVKQLIRDTDRAFKFGENGSNNSAGLLTPEHATIVGPCRNSVDKDLPPLPLRPTTPECRSRPSTASSVIKRPDTPKLRVMTPPSIVTTHIRPSTPSPTNTTTSTHTATAETQQMAEEVATQSQQQAPVGTSYFHHKEKKKPNKAKKPKAQKQPSLFKSSRLAPPRHNQHHARWTLTENVAELFSGFKRIEADEMISSEAVEEFRRKRQAKQQASSESLREDAVADITTPQVMALDDGETPIEPFHLEDLPTRIGRAGVQTSLSPIGETVVRKDFSIKRQPAPSPIPEQEELVVSPLSPTRPEYDLPIQTNTEGEADIPIPPRNPARNRRKNGGLAPDIPEVLVTSPDNRRHRPTSKVPFPTACPFAPSEDDDYVYFKSTPCTLTQPGLRHGAIRFAKADLDRYKESSGVAGDSTLDWTAFQMAILGGVGDYYMGGADWLFSGQHSDEEEASNLAEWFSDFGFESVGKLIAKATDETKVHHPIRSRVLPGGTPSTCEYSTASPVSSASGDDFDNDLDDDCDEDEYDDDADYSLDEDEVPTELDLPIPVVSEFPGGFWNREGPTASDKMARFSIDNKGNCGIKRWTVEGHPKPYRNSSVDSNASSLPMSPMMQIVAPSGAKKNEDAVGDGDLVPMGYNLGHDLGDFLRWEAEHVYAGGQYTDKPFA